MLNLKLENIVCLALGFIAGAFLLFLCASFFLDMPKLWGFSIYDLLKFIATMFIAVFVAFHLANKHSDSQIKKKAFLEIVDQTRGTYEKNLSKIYDFLRMDNRQNTDRNQMTLLFRTISNKIDVLDKSQNDYNNEVCRHVQQLKKCHFDIKSLITGSQHFMTQQPFPMTIINRSINKLHYALSITDYIKLKIFD